ncbi:swr1 complex component [Microsporum canis]
MQNGTPNGRGHSRDTTTPEHDGEPQRIARPSTPTDTLSEQQQTPQRDALQENNDGVAKHEQLNGINGPPSKRRKLAGTTGRTTPRPPSPPWKRAGFDGPTSFMENGKRRSTRTNTIPVEMLPEDDPRRTRPPVQTGPMNKTMQSWTHGQRESASPLGRAAKPETNGRRILGGSNHNNGGVDPSPSTNDVSRRATISKAASGFAKNSTQPQPLSQRRVSDIPRTSTSNPVGPNSPLDPPPKRKPGRPRRRQSDGIAIAKQENRLTSGDQHRSRIDSKDKDDGTSQKLPRLRFRVKMPSLGVQHPSHVLPPKQYSSFNEWLYKNTPGEEEAHFSSPKEALQEARIRLKLKEAGEPNQVLSKERCSFYLTDPEEAPPRQYSHQDHLVAHALYFKKLLDKERKHHRNLARLFAHWCADAWKKRNKAPEDILKEQHNELRQKRRQLIKDLQRQFDLVRAEVDRARLAIWEEERKVEEQLALNNALKKSTALFERRRSDRIGTGELDDEETDELSSDETEDSGDDSNMSSSGSETETDEGQDDNDDEQLSPEALRAKYANLASMDTSIFSSDNCDENEDEDDENKENQDGEVDPSETEYLNEEPVECNASLAIGEENAYVKLEEVDPLLLDESDESTDMDDDMGDSDEGDEGEDSDDAHDSDESDESDEGGGLLGFFSKGEAIVPNKVNLNEDSKHAMQDVDDTVVKSTHDLKGDEETSVGQFLAISKSPNKGSNAGTVMQGGDQSEATSPATVENGEIMENHRLAENASMEDGYNPLSKASSPKLTNTNETALAAEKTGIKTPIPHLLRGKLREYQHFGLDWLAGLYASNINGILADEMGLGKTIQTIALLAHLAVEHEVWGPHLVIVPTSVMLNWEMEFKKWCPGFKILTYYGTQEERRQKRKGWMDDDRWHVCITSYQLVLQDQQIFRRRNWHYMVLDEAHNIKNFRSQRWQTLLTFKTQARLLLTGTPLQNNLTELWSLLFFLMPSDEDSNGIEGFADLRNFSEWFRRPVEQILEHGRETMDDEAKAVVSKLHTILRPYILRRLKVDVEKQMPAKYEHVVACRLSKRQRYLYDGFMSRTQTKETLASGNYLSIINCLMQLRKVCNHPDLFETRPITTSFAMPNSVVVEFEIKDLLVRRRLLKENVLNKLDLDFLNLAPISREQNSKILVEDCARIMAYNPLNSLRQRQYNRTNWNMNFDGSTIQSTLRSMDNDARKARMRELERCLYFESKRHSQRPIYGQSLIDKLTIVTTLQPDTRHQPPRKYLLDWLSNKSLVLNSMVRSMESTSLMVEPLVQKFACLTPAAVAHGVTAATLTPITSRYFTPSQRIPAYDPFHEAQMRLSIAFPDKRLLQYDCGKLQQLDKLLRTLQAGGHRALIFTQMTKMLDILEQFLNIHGHRYLRLDGSTKIEQRQLLTERFNSDTRILAFILSSRSGGLGINLTGADTVIFYDLDWNPAMDKQCQDRCHRIGQTRDVHIYRFVSEYTIESNILRKANQKRMLDDVVIQEGEFTTDYLNRLDVGGILGDEELAEGHDEAGAAMDRVLDTKVHGTSRIFEQAEDKEDIDAAKTAEKEIEQAVDDSNFDNASTPQTPAPGQQPPSQSLLGTPAPTELGEYERSVSHVNGSVYPASTCVTPDGRPVEIDDSESHVGHIDDYLLRFMEWNLKDEPLVLPADRQRKKAKRGREHRIRRKR